jgi:hypothetical protein
MISLSMVKASVKSIFIAAKASITMETIPANHVVLSVPHVTSPQVTVINATVHHLRS